MAAALAALRAWLERSWAQHPRRTAAAALLLALFLARRLARRRKSVRGKVGAAHRARWPVYARFRACACACARLQVVLVTGGGSGIGRLIASRFAALG